MRLNVKDMIFVKAVFDPHTDGNECTVNRLRYGYPKPYEVEDIGGWLRVKGFKRTVIVGKLNVASMLEADEPAAVAEKGKTK